jgi:hypothetical protein
LVSDNHCRTFSITSLPIFKAVILASFLEKFGRCMLAALEGGIHHVDAKDLLDHG